MRNLLAGFLLLLPIAAYAQTPVYGGQVAATATAQQLLQAQNSAQAAQVAAQAALSGSTSLTIAPTASTKIVCDAVYNQATNTWTGTDNYVAIQSLLDQAGKTSKSTPLTYVMQGQAGNATQGSVTLPYAQRCVISSGVLTPPPGLLVNLNHSEIIQTTPGLGVFSYPFALNLYGYGRYGDVLRDGKLTGPGPLVSTAKGIEAHLTNHLTVDNVEVNGFRTGLDMEQAQYSLIHNSNIYNNYVGCHVAADPAYPNQPSIDNVFLASNCRLNVHLNLWNQGGTNLHVLAMDANFIGNSTGLGAVSVLTGGQLAPYISGWTLTGGSGCTPNSTIPLTITDSTGTMAAANVTVSAAGVPNATIQQIDGGVNYTAPTATVPGCSTQPTLTATIQNDQALHADGTPALGDYEGTAVTVSNSDYELKMEVAAPGSMPNTGYLIISRVANDHFTNLHPSLDEGSASFARTMRVEAQGTVVTNPHLPTVPYANPGNAADTCQFRVLINQGLGLDGYNFADANKPYSWICGPDVTTPASGATKFFNEQVQTTSIVTTQASPSSYYDGTMPTTTGTMWADDKYLYRRNSTGHIVRIPWSAFTGDAPADAGTIQ